LVRRWCCAASSFTEVALSFGDALHGWESVWESGGQRLLATADGGRSWRPLRLPCPPSLATEAGARPVSLVGADRGWVLCSGEATFSPRQQAWKTWLYGTVDGGRSWRLLAYTNVSRAGRVRSPGGISPFSQPVGIAFGPGGFGLLAAERLRQQPKEGPTLYVTTDAGRDWRPARYPFRTVARHWLDEATAPAVAAGRAFAFVSVLADGTVEPLPERLISATGDGRWQPVRTWWDGPFRWQRQARARRWARRAHAVFVSVADELYTLAAGGGSLWANACNGSDQSQLGCPGLVLARIDPRRGTLVREAPIGNGDESGGGIPEAYGASAVWFSIPDGPLYRLDPASLRPAGQRCVGYQYGNGGVAYAGGSVWVTDRGDPAVYRINPHTGRVQRALRFGQWPEAIAAGYGAVWVADASENAIVRIDLVTNKLRVIRLGPHLGPGSGDETVATGAGAVWALNDKGLDRIDPSTRKITARVHLHVVDNGVMAGFAAGLGGVWIAGDSNTLLRLDPRTAKPIRTINFWPTAQLDSVAIAAGRVWVGDGGGDLIGFKPTTLTPQRSHAQPPTNSHHAARSAKPASATRLRPWAAFPPCPDSHSPG
jgi:outer membrane protein assembly factor BamB